MFLDNVLDTGGTMPREKNQDYGMESPALVGSQPVVLRKLKLGGFGRMTG
jgi:hypothetical protein